jgi:hypothetical protein
MDFFSPSVRLDAVMCMGVTAGAYILTLFAVCFPWHSSHGLLLHDSKFCFDLTFLLVLLFYTVWPQMKYRQRVLGLILISPLCNAPSWTEWLYNKVPSLDPLMFCLQSSYPIFTLILNVILIYLQVLSNLLYYYGMCGVVKELLLKRYFSKVFSCI